IGQDRDIALRYTGAHEDALDGFSLENVPQVFQLEVSATHTDLVEGAALGQHVIALTCGRADTDDVEGVWHAAAVGQFLDRGDWVLFARVDGVRGTEFLGGCQRVIVQINHDDLRSTCNDRTTDGVEPNAAGADDCYGGTLFNLSGVEDCAGTGDDTTAQDCGLWEWHLFGDGDQHVLVHQCLLGEPAQAHALVQRLAVTIAKAWFFAPGPLGGGRVETESDVT